MLYDPHASPPTARYVVAESNNFDHSISLSYAFSSDIECRRCMRKRYDTLCENIGDDVESKRLERNSYRVLARSGDLFYGEIKEVQ